MKKGRRSQRMPLIFGVLSYLACILLIIGCTKKATDSNDDPILKTVNPTKISWYLIEGTLPQNPDENLEVRPIHEKARLSKETFPPLPTDPVHAQTKLNQLMPSSAKIIDNGVIYDEQLKLIPWTVNQRQSEVHLKSGPISQVGVRAEYFLLDDHIIVWPSFYTVIKQNSSFDVVPLNTLRMILPKKGGTFEVCRINDPARPFGTSLILSVQFDDKDD